MKKDFEVMLSDLESTTVDQALAKKFNNVKNFKGRIEDFINEFLGNFLSPQTKRAYIKDLELFFNFLKSGNQQVVHPKDIEAHHFQVYRDSMIENKLSSATINRRLVAIRSFLKWSVASKYTDHNPLDSVKLPKVTNESPTIAFDDHEVREMINAPDTSNKSGICHRITLVLLFNLGLRRSELAKIKIKDIYQDRGHWVLRIMGKGNKERNLPLSPTIIFEIEHYKKQLADIGNMILNDEDFIIQSRPKGKNTIPTDGSTIFRIVNRYAKLLGINKRVGAHSCRATVISHLLDTQNSPIRDVAIFAGHSNITTTERYDKRRKNLDNSAAYKVDYSDPDKAAS